jgi:hypothetical protein
MLSQTVLIIDWHYGAVMLGLGLGLGLALNYNVNFIFYMKIKLTSTFFRTALNKQYSISSWSEVDLAML